MMKKTRSFLVFPRLVAIMPAGILAIGTTTRLAVALLILLVSAPAALAQEAERRFGEWTAFCEADDLCLAVTGTAPRLRLERHPTRTFWQLSLDTAPHGAATGPAFTVAVAVDEFEETFDRHHEVSPYGSRTQFHFLTGKAQAMLDAMIRGQAIRFAYRDSNDVAHTVEFSLTGLSAALLWIDDNQNRIGSERVTGAPPYGLLPVGPELDLSIPVPADLVEAHRSSRDCEPMEELPNGRDSFVARLDEKHIVAFLPCFAGAYNFSSKVYVIDAYGYRQQHFAEYSDYSSWTSSDQLINAWFDEKSGELVSYAKGRGLGDCGSAGTWRWTGGFFRLEEYRNKDECDATGEPGEFPVVYTAEPMPE